MPNLWLENSDYVARYLYLENNHIVSDARVTSKPPTDVVERLASMSLEWSDLTTLAKQAILWDMGYVRATDDLDDLSQVYTTCISSGVGATMATIAVPERLFQASQSNATMDTCIGANGNYTRQNNAHGLLLGTVVKCAVGYLQEETTPNSHASMWAQDGLGTKEVPDPRFWRHEWHYPGLPSFLLFAIHTVPTSEEETGWGKCPPQGTPGSLIIPCTVREPPLNWSSSIGAPDDVTWCLPQQSSAMSKWLSDIKDAKSPKSHLSTMSVVLFAVCGGLIIFFIIFFLIAWRKKRKNEDYVRMTNRGSTEPKQTIQTASESLNAFQEDPYLCSKRLPYSSISCGRIISKGAYGEVWIGTLDENLDRNSEPMSSWRNKRTNLSCVTEYLSNGDLSSYLSINKNLEWKMKIRIGHSILKAIMYLHQLSPPVIHRDLKGKNVLVADDISAKLSDFGISRQRHAEETMTLGVGTAFWTAPEILLEKKYDASVDIYSFGCILSELDTHNKPYFEMKDIASLSILQKVAGQDGSSAPLRPKFTKTSPDWFREVASACLAHNPSLRPAIADLELQFARELERLESIDLLEEYCY
ncbi:kinase [Thraustotheca clavata]|uniref:Kinase n=1 Tax=Thraustotheca clavata TaxID=74557 RepID=A0A1V9ZWD8_9STRA|nr:kinase [Thraustotheca clavata]